MKPNHITMKHNAILVLVILCITLFTGCTQQNSTDNNTALNTQEQNSFFIETNKSVTLPEPKYSAEVVLFKEENHISLPYPPWNYIREIRLNETSYYLTVYSYSSGSWDNLDWFEQLKVFGKTKVVALNITIAGPKKTIETNEMAFGEAKGFFNNNVWVFLRELEENGSTESFNATVTCSTPIRVNEKEEIKTKNINMNIVEITSEDISIDCTGYLPQVINVSNGGYICNTGTYLQVISINKK